MSEINLIKKNIEPPINILYSETTLDNKSYRWETTKNLTLICIAFIIIWCMIFGISCLLFKDQNFKFSVSTMIATLTSVIIYVFFYLFFRCRGYQQSTQSMV